MKRLILKTALFVAPFIIIHLINLSVYNPIHGDLIRTGYIYNNPLPRHELRKEFFTLPQKMRKTSNLNLNKKHPFDFFTIGDSFSNQDSSGYNNIIANNNSSVLNYDRFLSNNPIQSLFDLTNGDFFEKVKIKTVILQSVEREFMIRFQNLKKNNIVNCDSIVKLVKKHNKMTPIIPKHIFFSKDLFNIPITNLLYHVNSKPLKSQTYKVQSKNHNLFSNNIDNILFFEGDLYQLETSNNKEKVLSNLQTLNLINKKLNAKGIKLILLIFPDKYDLYYPYFKEQYEFTKPMLYNYLDNTKADFTIINSKKILSKAIQKKTNVYYYDDTHCSPVGANIIAEEILRVYKK